MSVIIRRDTAYEVVLLLSYSFCSIVCHCVYGCVFCKKVKCTLVQALGLCTGRTAHRGVEV